MEGRLDSLHIPTKLIVDKNLRKSDLILFGLIDLLSKAGDGKCRASNEELAKLLGMTPVNVYYGLNHLLKNKYLTKGFDPKRTLKPNYELLNRPDKRKLKNFKILLISYIYIFNKEIRNKNKDIDLNKILKKFNRRTKKINLRELNPPARPSGPVVDKDKVNHRSKMIPFKEASDAARSIVSYWNEVHCGMRHKLNSKTVSQTLYRLDEYILKKYSAKRIKEEAIDVFALLMKAPKKHGLGKRTDWSIRRFFMVDEFVRKRVSSRGRRPLPMYERLLIEGPRSFGEYSDRELRIAEHYKAHYAYYVLGEVDVEKVSLRSFQKKDILDGAKMLCETMRQDPRLQGLIVDADGRPVSTDEDYVRHVFFGLRGRLGTWDRIKTRHLCEPLTYDDTLPRQLTREGYRC